LQSRGIVLARESVHPGVFWHPNFRHQPRLLRDCSGTEEDRAMATMTDRASKHDETTDQIARLRAQVEALMNERVTPVVADAAERAESVIHDAASMVREQADAVSGKVREQPLLSILIAAAVGYVFGRVTR
jgi:ElaB/YqjD/DUF883 family membrane-anchored ribosome-binding protein